ncbi:hypothetical protein HK405_001436, partial [Cladochytrium tenue]
QLDMGYEAEEMTAGTGSSVGGYHGSIASAFPEGVAPPAPPPYHHQAQPPPPPQPPQGKGATEADERSRAYKRKAWRSRIRNIVLVFVLPGILYNILNEKIGDWQAVLVSAVPVALAFALSLRNGEFDVTRPAFLLAYAITALVAWKYPEPRIPYIKNVISLGLLGLAFLLSILTGWNFIYITARLGEKDLAKRAEVDKRYRESAVFRRGTVFLSLVWGVGLLMGAGAIAAVVWASGLSITVIKWVDLALTLVDVGGLSLFTWWIVNKAKSRVQDRVGARAA